MSAQTENPGEIWQRAPWAATVEHPAACELPRVAWATYGAATPRHIGQVSEEAPSPDPLPTPLESLAFHCAACNERFANPTTLLDHVTTAHNRAEQRRAYHAEHGRARRAKKKGLPTPPARPKVSPEPPTTRERRRQPATVLAPSPARSTDLARAKARIAARHGTTPCSVCGTAKGAGRGYADERPYRDSLGRCCACHEAKVLREHLAVQA